MEKNNKRRFSPNHIKPHEAVTGLREALEAIDSLERTFGTDGVRILNARAGTTNQEGQQTGKLICRIEAHFGNTSTR